jgi:hypothetical protein
MRYDLSQKNVIKIKGKTDEIRDWIKEISLFMDKGTSYSIIEKEVNNLEKIVEPVNYTFLGYHRIYFNHNSLIYLPNVSEESREIYFKFFKEKFDIAKTKMDEKYGPKNTRRDK